MQQQATVAASPQPHPNVLALELSSLRSALAHYQHAADNAALQLQRRSYETTSALERTKQLELENARLSRELTILSSTPDTTPHPDTLNVSQLTLAHRRLSERLSITENLLLEKTQSLESLSRKAHTSVAFAEQCRGVLEKTKLKEEAAKYKAKELETALRSVLVEKEFVERTVGEYAELVRRLERQRKASSAVMINGSASASAILTPTRTTSDGSSPPSIVSSIDLPTPASSPAQTLETGRAGLNRLLSEFNTTTESLHAEIARLHTELEDTKLQLAVERKASEESQAKLALAIVDLDRYKVDDNAAAKLVERYMKFSQTSIDLLQSALSNQKTRSAAHIDTLEDSITALHHAFSASRSQTSHLRDVLDELTEDISRESSGRRREVALRLKVVEREERTVGRLRGIVTVLQEGEGDARDVLQAVLDELLELVEGLEGGHALLGDEGEEMDVDGSLARIISCEETVASLSQELHEETERRLHLEKKLADLTMGVEHEQDAHDVPATTPSDLGMTPPHEEVREKEKGLVVHPLTPREASRGSSPMEIQQPLPIEVFPEDIGIVQDAEVGKVYSVEEQASGSAEEETKVPPSEPVVLPVVVVAPVPVLAISPTLHEDADVVIEPTQPSPFIAPLLTPLAIDTPRKESNLGSVPPTPLSTHQLDSIPPTPLSTQQLNSIPPTPLSANQPAPSPLIAALARTASRYDSTSTALRTSSAILTKLKADFTLLTAQLHPAPATVPIFRAYLDRIADFLEDCRVELEIRVADEARVVKGFEALLALPRGASEGAVEERVRRFVEGEDAGVVKAVESFARKVEELEHDIALLKRAIYDAGLLETSSQVSPGGGTSAPWSWTNFGGPSRSRPTSPAPTFGAVMTQQRSPTIGTLPSPVLGHPPLDVDQKTLDEIVNLPFRISMPKPILPPPTTTMLLEPSAGGHSIGMNSRASLSSTSLNLPATGAFGARGRRASGIGGGPKFNMLRSHASAVWSPVAPMSGLGSAPSTPRLGVKGELGGAGEVAKDSGARVGDDSGDVE